MNIDWSKLGFAYMQTKSHIRYVWKDGKWDGGELVSEPYLNIHIAATALHYGQDAFEGLKVFRRKDGKLCAQGVRPRLQGSKGLHSPLESHRVFLGPN